MYDFSLGLAGCGVLGRNRYPNKLAFMLQSPRQYTSVSHATVHIHYEVTTRVLVHIDVLKM